MEDLPKILIQIVVPSFVTGVIGFFAGYKIQKLKNRPQPITHHCRISGQDVYTFFDSNNNPSKPACIFLSKSGNCQILSRPARIHMTDYNIERERADIQHILDLHEEKCYLAEWNK